MVLLYALGDISIHISVAAGKQKATHGSSIRISKGLFHLWCKRKWKYLSTVMKNFEDIITSTIGILVLLGPNLGLLC